MKNSRIDELRDDILSLKRYIALLWRNKIVFIKYSVVAVVVGVVFGLSLPKIYSSTTILALEPRNTGYDAAVMSLAGMAGFNLGFLSEDAYSVELYPTIISSKDFVEELAKMPLCVPEKQIDTTYASYLLSSGNNTWWGNAAMWAKNIFAGSDSVAAEALPTQSIGKIRGNTRCMVDKRLNLVTITAYDTTPEVAKIVSEAVTDGLNAFIQDYRTSKTRADYEALSLICDSAKARYIRAQADYQNYIKSHTGGNSTLFRAQSDFLEGEAQLAYAVYNQMASQVQMAQVKLQESTPVYNVIQKAYVPQAPESQSMLAIVLLFVIAACALAAIKITYIRVKEKLWGV